MRLNKRYVHVTISFLTLLATAATAVAVWKGVIPIEWLVSFGYKGVFAVSLLNSAAPVAGPSQLATFVVAARLNPFFVGVAAGVGSAIGEMAGYAFGYFVRGSLSDKAEQRFERFGNWRLGHFLRHRSFVTLLVLASIPNPLFDPVSALAGSLRIGLGRYFVPVLLGKTLRHVVIAYVGFFTLTKSVHFVTTTNPMPLIYSLIFVAVVVFIAFLAWLIRSSVDSEPDPLLLNLTFFAFAGQLVLTVELFNKSPVLNTILILLDAIALLVVLGQSRIVQGHATKTVSHYETLLSDRGVDVNQASIWAKILLHITGVDFYPEFYQQHVNIRFLKLNTPEDRRRLALRILSSDLFKDQTDRIKESDLLIRTDERVGPWRLYVRVCVAAWVLFIGCIIAGRLL
jgi:membrane protein YqaA with SNARE-associated domain